MKVDKIVYCRPTSSPLTVRRGSAYTNLVQPSFELRSFPELAFLCIKINQPILFPAAQHMFLTRLPPFANSTSQDQGQYRNTLFFATYKWAQKARVFLSGDPSMLSAMKHSSL